jgi:hypothetical protein
MPSRQKNLLVGLIAAVLLWQGGMWGDRLVLEPLRLLRADLARRQEKVEAKRNQLLSIEQARAKLIAWRNRSLAVDPGKRARPDAVEAHRQYTAWLTELVHAVGFDEVAVTPQRKSVSRDNVYVEVAVQIDGEGRLSQLAELMDRFYRTDLLQRIGRLKIASEDVFGDPPVKFTLEANALALDGAPVRRTLFPRTSLAAELSSAATHLVVQGGEEFPKKTPFRIRIERELLDVTELAGETWTVTRGVERTEPREHAAKAPLTLVRINPTIPELTRDEFREFVRTNVFVKPTPPLDYDFRFGPFPPAVVVRGKSWEYSIAAKDYDPARGEPKYRIRGDAPTGLSLNEATGQLVWKPDATAPAGEYPIVVEVVHPSAANGQQSETLSLTLAEPNSPPKFSAMGPQTAYRGQPWKMTVAAEDPDQPKQRVTFKLGPGAPEGARIDAQSGELTWTPPEQQPLGAVSLTVTATDDGTPPKTSHAVIPLTVMEDTAKQTALIGVVSIGEEREAWFLDKSQNRKTILRIGDEIRAADIVATVMEIDEKTVTIRRGDADFRLKLGDSIRSLSTAAPITRNDSAETPR